MGKVIGIDLGTTNSVVAVMEGGEPVVIPNSEGGRTTPSVVAFTKDGERLVGQVARRQAITNPENTIFSIKRFMGRKSDEVTAEQKLVPYEVKTDSKGRVEIKIPNAGKTFTPPEISAMILQKMKQTAEDYLGQKVEQAVITVPAYFNDAQRQATKDAGHIAGLEVARIINEPTAAAMAYGLDKRKEETIVVFDLGGGTFDVSVLQVSGTGEDDDARIFQVLSTSGDTHLGGDDFDQELINYVADEFKKEQGIDLRPDHMALQRLQEACEKAKMELSNTPQTDINLPFVTADASGPKHLQLSITRSKFEELIDKFMSRVQKPIEQALADAKMKPSDIDEVVLVGGSTRIPKIYQLVKDYFGKEPHKGVNPDEVVAIGAAIQGSVLAGEREDVLLLDVTPLSLGIETEGGIFTKLVERNTTIPIEKKQSFSTAEDNQSAVTVVVYQGERQMARDNRLLGQFNLEDIPPAPRGMPQVEVKFDLDENGILNVSAIDLGTDKEASVRIEQSAGLSDDEIQRMQKDAEQHAGEDKHRREMAEARNQSEHQCYQLEKVMQEHEGKMSEADREPLTMAIEKVRQATKGDDVSAVKSAMNELEQASHAFSQAIYAATEPQPAGASSGNGQGSSSSDVDDAIDAEFEVKS